MVERRWAHDGMPLDWRARPGLSINMRRSTSFSVFAERSDVTLRPIDAPNLSVPTVFRPNTWAMVASTSPRPAWGASLDVTAGKAINFAPAAATPPQLGDQMNVRLNLSVRPLTPLRIANTWLYASLNMRGARAFASHTLRTQWAWQFTREWSLRFIGQYDSVSIDPLRSSLTPRRNLNADVLLTRLINPWTALYVGYNGNGQNLELIETDRIRRLQRTHDLTRDAWQVFVKWSYLWRT
jgi:hypothetical protein